MRVRSRFLSVAFAVALSAAMVPAAVADEPPPERPMVYCPDATEVSAIVGETFTGGTQARDSCSYSGASMNISFAFFGGSQTGELEKMRKREVDGGTTVVDVPALGPLAFGYAGTDDWNVRWEDSTPAGHIFFMNVPLTRQDITVSMAQLFVAAIAAAPAPTVPAKAFTMVCPSAAQVEKIVGRKVTVVPRDDPSCKFKAGENWDDGIDFFIVPGYGSIDEYRARMKRETTHAGVPPIAFLDVGGLTPGAFAYADLSPVTLSWQLQEGVVAQLVAREDTDVLRRLAALFAAVQTSDARPTMPAGPSRPGLPSTGD